ncbi:MAG: class I tRNA ligase family protein, partial [Acidobacteria bacterium]|nr:class I tRNA ligase family protein [Acidobacteriota bacterium]
PQKDAVKYEDMVEIDRFILNLFNKLIPKVTKAYEDYSFHIIHRELLQFCTVTLSAFYLDILKDRLYCSGKKSVERLSAQTVLHTILVGMLKLLAPILPFTAEEAWKCLYGEEKETIHIETFPEKFLEEDAKLIEKWEKLWSIRDLVNKSLEESRQKGEIGKSLEAKVVIYQDGEVFDLLQDNLKILPDIFIVSQVEVVKGESSVKVVPLKTDKCMRCWNIPVETVEFEGEKLCQRCNEVVAKL